MPSVKNTAEEIKNPIVITLETFFAIFSAPNTPITFAVHRMYQANSFRRPTAATAPEGGGLENEARRRRMVGVDAHGDPFCANMKHKPGGFHEAPALRARREWENEARSKAPSGEDGAKWDPFCSSLPSHWWDESAVVVLLLRRVLMTFFVPTAKPGEGACGA